MMVCAVVVQADLYRCRTAVDNLCACGAVEHSVHFFLSCPLYTAQRAALARAVGPDAMDLSNLLSNVEIVADVMRFIKDTGRFPRYSASDVAAKGQVAVSRRWEADAGEGRW